MSTYQSGDSPVYSLSRLFYKIRQVENRLSNITTGGTGSLTKAQADTFYKPIDYVPAFSVITGKPTTISGYGITDAFTKATADTLYRPISYVPTFASITSKPTTISGYGITDAFTQATADTLYRPISYVPTFNSITGKPTTLSGYGITDAYPLTGNPSAFLTSVPAQSFASLTGVPTTISGYGITDGVTLTGTQTLTGKTISGASNTFTAIPSTAITGLGTMSTQNSNAVAITGGSISGLSSMAATNITASGDITAGNSLAGFRLLINNTTTNGTGGTNGTKMQFSSHVSNDNSTAASGTIAMSSAYTFGQPTLTATNTGVTTTNAANLYIAGDPIAGTNQTITNSYGLYNVGKTYLGNSLVVNGGSIINSSALTINGTTKGIRIPQMTSAQKTAIASPVSGLLVDQSDGTGSSGLQRYNGTNWQPIAGVQGSSVQSGNGTTTSFTIAHGLGYIPTFVNVDAGSNDADGTLIKYRTADATNITIVYKTAPVTGTNNLTFYYSAK